MTIIELGALGEFLGAMGVIATLIYLSIQVKHNTRSMNESRQLALAQTYQMRADALHQQGFLDPEYYDDEFKVRVPRLAPTWAKLGLKSGRKSFQKEIERLAAAARSPVTQA